jgi:hypothetical protein
MATQKNNTITIDQDLWSTDDTSGHYTTTSHDDLTIGSITYGAADSYTFATGSNTSISNGGIYGTLPDWSALNATSAGSISASGKVELHGESADIVIDGVSLKATLETLQERLNWMRPAPEIEAEWDELRELGDRYRELEKQCREKSQMWTKLKTVTKTDQA